MPLIIVQTSKFLFKLFLPGLYSCLWEFVCPEFKHFSWQVPWFQAYPSTLVGPQGQFLFLWPFPGPSQNSSTFQACMHLEYWCESTGFFFEAMRTLSMWTYMYIQSFWNELTRKKLKIGNIYVSWNIFVAAPIDLNSIQTNPVSKLVHMLQILHSTRWTSILRSSTRVLISNFKVYIPVSNSFWVFLKSLCTFLPIFCDKRFQNMF